MQAKILRLILGDQLNYQHSWFKRQQSDVVYVIAQLNQELNYVRHHVQKVVAFFAAMESFARKLKKDGHQVIFLDLANTQNFDSLPDLLSQLIKKHDIKAFQFQRPDEFRLVKQLEEFSTKLKSEQAIDTQLFDTEHFLLSFDKIKDEFTSGKHKKMEFFYRKMRKRLNLLMEDDEPRGGQWNFDKKNREVFQSEDIKKIPKPLLFDNKVDHILKLLDDHDVDTIGTIEKVLNWPIDREQGLQLLENFCENNLASFGKFQDAMTQQSDYSWSLYHSRLSFLLNSKIMSPLEIVNYAIEYFENHDAVDIAQIEGFVRQIIGWREYVRGIYWSNMPKYSKSNALSASRSLPDYFWNGKTKMNCMSQSISQSLTYAYAHHIQRLMVTGNFALLTGLAPDEVDEWYLGIYIDAIEWVEMPNTRGMALFADGGIIATKPYAASGNYINKMSDYCKQCHYKVNKKTGEKACPFNSLYWYFMNKHKDKLKGNPRTNMIYKNWEKQSTDSRQATIDYAESLLNNINDL